MFICFFAPQNSTERRKVKTVFETDDIIELDPETWSNGASPDSPIDCWCCYVCRRACGFVSNDFPEDGEDPLVWLPTYECQSTGNLFCEDHGRIDINQLVADFRQVTLTVSHGDLNILRAYLISQVLQSRVKLSDPEYLAGLPAIREDICQRNKKLFSIACLIDEVMDNQIIGERGEDE